MPATRLALTATLAVAAGAHAQAPGDPADAPLPVDVMTGVPAPPFKVEALPRAYTGNAAGSGATRIFDNGSAFGVYRTDPKLVAGLRLTRYLALETGYTGLINRGHYFADYTRPDDVAGGLGANGFQQFVRNLVSFLRSYAKQAGLFVQYGYQGSRSLDQYQYKNTMLVAHRIRLDPNNVQATYFARAAGTARFAYNWALSEWRKQYEACETDSTLPKPSEAALRRRLNSIKREQFPWMLEVTKNAPQMAIMQLGRAFENFFAGRARYPRFRRKGQDDRFTLSNDQFRVERRRIRIPKLGWVRMRETLRFAGRIVSASVARVANHWYASITVETSDLPAPPAKNQGSVGIDLGVKALATLSTGETFEGPKALRALLMRLRQLSRAVSRKVKGSRNHAKAKLKLAKLHARIADIRRNSLHQLSTSITRRFHTIGIEDLNVKGMLGNRHLARAIADMGFYELRRQLDYKAAWRGGQVVLADRWFPSSKLCSGCGYRLNELGLDVRHWTCPSCGASHDRDVNAATNLRNMAVSSTASACGGEGAGPARERRVKPAPAKQEFNGKVNYG